MSTSPSPPPSKTTTPKLVHTILHSALPPSEKTFDRIFAEVSTVTGAAWETTASLLRLVVFHIYANPAILSTLRQELAALDSEYSLRQLEQLPYFTAVLTEGMRLSPAVSSRAARITDKDLHYKEWRIPAGTPVSMTTILMHTDESIYPEPLRFEPERWMGTKARGARAPVYAPFSKGTRVCLGMQ